MVGWFGLAKEYRLALENVYVERWKLSQIAVVYSVV